MMHRLPTFGLLITCLVTAPAIADTLAADWPQWRGPTRDGQVTGLQWPQRLTKENFKQVWRVPMKRSYSGPLICGDIVFTTETKDAKSEAAIALDRKTGKELWRTEWQGGVMVPFFALPNGNWIRATPAFDGERLYVAGMRDLLLCLDGKSGKELWRVDFVAQLKAPEPAFGFVSSPLVDGDALYVQAGASTVKLNKKSGEILWRSLKDEGGMNGSAFASPIIAELAGKRQLIVQTREKLCGADLDTGGLLWSQPIPNYRGMNILTPLVIGDTIFTSTYRNGSWLYQITREKEQFKVSQVWNNNTQGYLTSPVLINGGIYVYLQSQRLACLDAKTGQRNWASDPFGKYWSLIANGDRILALDHNGTLRLIRADSKEFQLVDTLKVVDADTWAHLAVSGPDVVIRELDAITAYRWEEPK